MLDCIDDQTSQHFKTEELRFCSQFSNCVILPGRNHCPWLRSVTDGLRTYGKQKSGKADLRMQSECVHVPTASTITVKMKKKISGDGRLTTRTLQINRCIIDQDHIFSLRKKPIGPLKISWRLNTTFAEKWTETISWKPATNFDYHKKLQGWLNIYMYIVSICFFKKQQLMVMGPVFLCLCVCGFY